MTNAANIELVERRDAYGVVCAEDGFVVAVPAEIAIDHGGTWHAGGVAEAASDLEAAAQSIAREQGEDVGLVIVEQAKALIIMIAALAARERVGDPAEETLEQLLSEQDLQAKDAAGAILGQRLPDRRGLVLAARDEVVELLVEAHGFEGQGRAHLQRETTGEVQGIGAHDRRVAEDR